MVVFYRPISRSLPLSRSLARRIINTDTDTNRNWPGRSPWNGENSRRVNLNFFYCVLTCHTCDHAIKVSRFFVFSVPSANGEGPPRVGDRHLRISDNPAIFPPRSHYNACSRYRPPYAIFHSARAFLPPSFDSNEWTLCVTLYNPDRKIFLKSRISRIKNNVVFLSLENKIGNERKKEFIFTIVSIVGKDIGPAFPRERSDVVQLLLMVDRYYFCPLECVWLTVYLFRWPVNVAGH